MIPLYINTFEDRRKVMDLFINRDTDEMSIGKFTYNIQNISTLNHKNGNYNDYVIIKVSKGNNVVQTIKNDKEFYNTYCITEIANKLLEFDKGNI